MVPLVMVAAASVGWCCPHGRQLLPLWELMLPPLSWQLKAPLKVHPWRRRLQVFQLSSLSPVSSVNMMKVGWNGGAVASSRKPSGVHIGSEPVQFIVAGFGVLSMGVSCIRDPSLTLRVAALR